MKRYKVEKVSDVSVCFYNGFLNRKLVNVSVSFNNDNLNMNRKYSLKNYKFTKVSSDISRAFYKKHKGVKMLSSREIYEKLNYSYYLAHIKLNSLDAI